MKKIIPPAILVVSGIILALGVSPLLSRLGMGMAAFIGFLVFALVAWCFLKVYGKQLNPYKIAGYLFLGLVLFELPFIMIYPTPGLKIFLLFLFELFGIMSGYFFYARKTLPIPLKLILLGIILECAVSPLRGYISMQICSVGGFITFLLAANYLLKKFSDKLSPYLIISYLALGLFILQAPVRVFSFESGLISLPDFVIHILGITAGYFFYERNRLVHKINLSVSVLIVAFTYFYGYGLWNNKLTFGTYTSEVYYKIPVPILLKNAYNEPITLKKGKLTVLDFWFIGCGSCMNAFPKFQKLYDNYKNNPNVQFYSVNQPYHADNGVNCFKFLNDYNYTFPMAVCPDMKLTKGLEVYAYPTIIVIDPNGYIVYKGRMEGATDKIKTYL